MPILVFPLILMSVLMQKMPPVSDFLIQLLHVRANGVV